MLCRIGKNGIGFRYQSPTFEIETQGLHHGTKQGCQMVCFQTKNQNLGKFCEGLAMDDVGIFYGHLVHFTVFCYILLTFGIVHGNLLYFPDLVFCT
jgi:hypothetical protein